MDFVQNPVPWEPMGYYYDPDSRPGLHPYHEAGVYYLQEASAMSAVALLDPQPGEKICDLCAAPGGKTTQIAGRMLGEGFLLCNEINPKRAKILSRNIERMGVANALVTNEHPARLAEKFPAYFDRVLIDAPCSGEGMFRKEEIAVSEWSEDNVRLCAERQTEILENAVKALKNGGFIVYATCTFSLEENDKIGIIGVKGCGKSTLLRLLTGATEPTSGEVYLSRGKTIGILTQDGAFDCENEDQTVLERMYRSFPRLLEMEERLATLEKSLAGGDERTIHEYSDLNEKYTR
jgi:precorrin-6B methylase 2